MPLRFSPGDCCGPAEPQAVCIYTGKYSDGQLLQLLDRDYRSDTSRAVPWYYPVDGYWQTIYQWPAIAGPPPCYALYSRQWQLNAAPTSPTLGPWGAADTLQPADVLDAAAFYSLFGGGLTPAIALGGLGGSDWSRTVVPIGITSNDAVGTELPYHSWYLQILLYCTRSNPAPQTSNGFTQNLSVTCKLLVMPLDHTTGTASAYYAACLAQVVGAKYFSVALVPWSVSQQRVCLTDCGLYTCSCASASGNIARIPTAIVAYPSPFGSIDGSALADALGEGEIYPSGNYYYVWGDSPVAPGYTNRRTGLHATTFAAVFPTAEDLRDLEACNAAITAGWNGPTGRTSFPPAPPLYCGLYRCGQPVITADGAGLLPEGVQWRYEQYNAGNGAIAYDYSHVVVRDSGYTLYQETCPATWPGPTNCRWATTTARRWNNCASCRVIECRNPTALANGVSSLGVGQVRICAGADYYEVRSGVCNAACRGWQL